MEFVTVENGPFRLNVAVAGKGPLILCVHGWPELAYSWRHQLAHFAAARLPGCGARRTRLRWQQQAARDRGLHAAEPGLGRHGGDRPAGRAQCDRLRARLGRADLVDDGADASRQGLGGCPAQHPLHSARRGVVHRHDEGRVPGPLLLPALFPARGPRRRGTGRRRPCLAAKGLLRMVGLGTRRDVAGTQAGGREAARRAHRPATVPRVDERAPTSTCTWRRTAPAASAVH